jgi:CRP-like cAMP-binding protein
MAPLANSANHFLASLSAHDGELMKPHLHPFELPHEGILYKADDTISRLYFPQSGVVSLVVGFANGQFVEAGMFGRNSVICPGAALDGGIALNQAIGQVGGAGLAVEVNEIKRLVAQSETLRVAFVRHDQLVSAQVQQVAACNALHELEERLSRWLLQTRDLIKSDTLPLTQEFLSQMLGVQRSSVTLVARKLQEAGLINYRRGRIHVLEVEGLRESCCECYEAINRQFRRLVGWSPDVDDHAAQTSGALI